jgi:hypothetical protein
MGEIAHCFKRDINIFKTLIAQYAQSSAKKHQSFNQ